MKKILLFAAGLVLVLAISFFGGQQLGRSMAYRSLVFDLPGAEIVISYPLAKRSVLITRFPDLSKLKIELDSQELAGLKDKLRKVAGLKDFSIESDGVSLSISKDFRPEEVIQEVLRIIFPKGVNP